MIKFTFEEKNYIAFDKKEPLNPHKLRNACIVEADTGEIPLGSQRTILLRMLDSLGVTFTKYKLKDTNTHDLVKVILKMSRFFNA